MDFSVYGKNYLDILAKNLSPLPPLHCYRQNASIFAFVSDRSVKQSLLKKMHVKFVVPKLQEHYCTAQEEMVSWNLVLYPMSQLLHYFLGKLELSYC